MVHGGGCNVIEDCIVTCFQKCRFAKPSELVVDPRLCNHGTDACVITKCRSLPS